MFTTCWPGPGIEPRSARSYHQPSGSALALAVTSTPAWSALYSHLCTGHYMLSLTYPLSIQIFSAPLKLACGTQRVKLIYNQIINIHQPFPMMFANLFFQKNFSQVTLFHLLGLARK